MRREDHERLKFEKRFETLGLKIDKPEMDRMYRLHLAENESMNRNPWEVNEAAFQLAMAREAMQMSYGAAGGSVIEPDPDPNPLPSGCIRFVNDTTNGLTSYIEFTVSAETSFTLDWGDGEILEDTISYNRSLSHDYAEPDTEYICTLCFADASLVTTLDFPGND